MSYMVRLGRLRLRTAHTTELTLGDGLEAVGAALVPGERRPRALPLTIAVRADEREPDRQAVGRLLRRQVEAWLENPALRLTGAWFAFDADPDLAAFLQIGGGTLSIDDRSLTFAEYELELDGVYRVGRLRTHWPARRIDVTDLRLPTSPRDPRERYYGSDFATFPAQSLAAIPQGATSVRPVTVAARAHNRYQGQGNGAAMPVFTGLPNGEVVTFAVPDPTSRELGDVVIYDRGPGGAADYNPPDTQPYDPTSAGWVEVYGPDQALTPGDVPVLDNGTCRVRHLRPSDEPAGQRSLGFAIERYETGWNTYRDMGRVVLTDDTAFYSLEQVLVHEWTPERAVVRATFTGLTAEREVWITLQRGWSGPRFDVYGKQDFADAPQLLYVLPPSAASASKLWALNAAPNQSIPPMSATTGYANSGGEFAFTGGREPWLGLYWDQPDVIPGFGPTATTVLTPGSATHTSAMGSSARAYPGSTRAGIRFKNTGWVSMRLAFAPGAPAAGEAENARISGVQQSNATASGGQEVGHGQLTPAAITCMGQINAQAAETIVAVRARANNVNSRVTTAAAVGAPTAQVCAPRVTTNYDDALDWWWLRAPNTNQPQLRAYNPATGGNVDTAIDRTLTFAGVAAGQGVEDRARQALMDTRAVPTLVAR